MCLNCLSRDHIYKCIKKNGLFVSFTKFITDDLQTCSVCWKRGKVTLTCVITQAWGAMMWVPGHLFDFRAVTYVKTVIIGTCSFSHFVSKVVEAVLLWCVEIHSLDDFFNWWKAFNDLITVSIHVNSLCNNLFMIYNHYWSN